MILWVLLAGYSLVASLIGVLFYSTVVKNETPLIQDIAVPAIMGAMMSPLIAMSGPGTVAPIALATYTATSTGIDPIKSLNNLLNYAMIFLVSIISVTIIIYYIFKKKETFDDDVPPIIKYLGL